MQRKRGEGAALGWGILKVGWGRGLVLQVTERKGSGCGAEGATQGSGPLEAGGQTKAAPEKRPIALMGEGEASQKTHTHTRPQGRKPLEPKGALQSQGEMRRDGGGVSLRGETEGGRGHLGAAHHCGGGGAFSRSPGLEGPWREHLGCRSEGPQVPPEGPGGAPASRAALVGRTRDPKARCCGTRRGGRRSHRYCPPCKGLGKEKAAGGGRQRRERAFAGGAGETGQVAGERGEAAPGGADLPSPPPPQER